LLRIAARRHVEGDFHCGSRAKEKSGISYRCGEQNLSEFAIGSMMRYSSPSGLNLIMR
jgi:hypothetical protein